MVLACAGVLVLRTVDHFMACKPIFMDACCWRRQRRLNCFFLFIQAQGVGWRWLFVNDSRRVRNILYPAGLWGVGRVFCGVTGLVLVTYNAEAAEFGQGQRVMGIVILGFLCMGMLPCMD